MKLIRERINDVAFLKEEATGEKPGRLYIEGIFMMGEIRNANGRIYPMKVLESAVESYTKDMIKSNRAVGELNHPETPQLNYERACIKTVSLRREGNNYVGKALVLSSPMGKLVESLINDEVQIAVSSRGLASVSEENGSDVIQDDFQICAAADVVSDPSAPDAFVQGVMENRNWVFENGIWTAKSVSDFKTSIRKSGGKHSAEKIQSAVSRLFSEIALR